MTKKIDPKLTELLKRFEEDVQVYNAYDLNDGYCYDFGQELENYFTGEEYGTRACHGGNTSQWESRRESDRNAPIHCFVHHDGKWYDAEALQGVNSPTKLPIFKEYFAKRKRGKLEIMEMCSGETAIYNALTGEPLD